MPKSKARKQHKSKVNARNTDIKMQKEKSQKMQKDFIMNLIKQEQDKGMFDNVASGDAIINGPSISFDGDLLTMNDIIESEEVKNKE